MDPEDPRFHQEKPPPEYKLYPIKAAVWATIWGSIVAGAIVMAINHRRVGEPRAAIYSVILGLVAFAVLMTVGFLIPEDWPVPNAVFYVAQLAMISGAIKVRQGALIAQHVDQGGSLASAWKGVGIGLIVLVALVVVAIAVFFTIEGNYGDSVRVNGIDEVYYTDGATETEALKLGEALTRYGFLGDDEDSGGYVRISREDLDYAISFPLIDDAWNEPETVAYYEELGDYLAETFRRPLRIHLCDWDFVVKKTIVID